MKRVLFVLFGLTMAMTVTGMLVAFARPSRWPANVTPSEWRRALGEKVERITEAIEHPTEEAAA